MTITTIRIRDAAATPWSAASFCHEGGAPTVLFEAQSAESGGEAPAYSLLMTKPRRWLVERGGRFIEEPSGVEIDDPVRWMADGHRAVEIDESVLFTGGIAGFLGFEFGWRLDAMNVAPRRSGSPQMWVGEFWAGAVFDHRADRWTVAGRNPASVKRLAETIRDAPKESVAAAGSGERIDDGVTEQSYCDQVGRAVDAIYGGEFFEVNFTERIRGRWRGDRRALYDKLRRRAPGDFGGMVDVPEVFIASVSPEQFLRVDAAGEVITRPIKGTRPRGESPEEDERLARELVESEKDRAENVMIVDLMRNDLTRVCRPGTVRATQLCKLHSFESVHHLVSTVRGELAAEQTALDAFLAGFPAGSITGAPKLRSMEWIANCEQTARGPYTGSMFYWSDHGRLDSNVLIRSAVVVDEQVEYGTGGAVVADSDPGGEYEEAMWKAAPFLALMEDVDER